MVAEEFFTLITQFELSKYVGLEDFADRLSFMFSVVLLILTMMVVTVKSYFFKPLACYTPTNPSGSGFDDYLENYCWVHGTISILPGEKLPSSDEVWSIYDETRRITYYQWVPFILALQCIMFYAPRVIWDFMAYSKAGVNLQEMVLSASEASKKSPDERDEEITKIVCILEDMFYQHRDNRKGKYADLRTKVFNMCNFCVCSKQKGTFIVFTYLLMKIIYASNAIFQLWMMKQFLGFDKPFYSFGYYILKDIMAGYSWHHTGIFPRVTYCFVQDIRHLGAKNAYTAQCALPINMLNEKIYIFLWFWIFFVAMITLINIPLWYFRLAFISKQSRFIRRFLQQRSSYENDDKPLVRRFIQDFLRHDGVFLLRMIFINAGDIVASDIVSRLWKVYKNTYSRLDLNCCNDNGKDRCNNHNGNDSVSTEEIIHDKARLSFL